MLFFPLISFLADRNGNIFSYTSKIAAVITGKWTYMEKLLVYLLFYRLFAPEILQIFRMRNNIIPTPPIFSEYGATHLEICQSLKQHKEPYKS